MLRMHCRVAINLAGRCLQHLYLQALGETKHIDGANDAGLGGLYRILLVVDWRCRASKIEDLIDLDKKWMGDVMAQELEASIVEEMLNMASCSGKEVVHTQHLTVTLQ
jgi:hypothetical protein